ncbi:MAG: type II toxin-antitoxin system RelE/ParE family toxin [Thiohalocapsa sp.]
MAAYSLSGKATSDLDGIYEYTILNFGLEQARTYLIGLHERFQILADNPGVGRSAAQLSPDLRRHAHQSHIVFYVPREKGVLIVRVLHARMDAKRHFGETDTYRT